VTRLDREDYPRQRIEEALLHLEAAVRRLDALVLDLRTSERLGEAVDLSVSVSTAVAELRQSAFMLMASLPPGECRRSRPYAPLQPVLDENGLRWCCNHPTEHCVPG
jgi:hypothetical protein